jgi:hypothetical protein
MSIGNGDEWLESKTRLHRTDTTHHHNATNREAKRAEAAIHTMSPARRALMASPRPVPPNTRVVDTSACATAMHNRSRTPTMQIDLEQETTNKGQENAASERT